MRSRSTINLRNTRVMNIRGRFFVIERLLFDYYGSVRLDFRGKLEGIPPSYRSTGTLCSVIHDFYLLAVGTIPKVPIFGFILFHTQYEMHTYSLVNVISVVKMIRPPTVPPSIF